MSRKGNRGGHGASNRGRPQGKLPPPMMWECPKHGIQRQVGIKAMGKTICIECMMDLFERECGIMPELGAKPDENKNDGPNSN